MKLKKHKFKNIFTDGKNLYTRNLSPGYRVYGERLIRQDNVEYRAWNPRRSKLAAMLMKGCGTFPITEKNRILYLGAATGTTASHVSDIAYGGDVYCVEFSTRAFRDLLIVCKKRKNMLPIIADANHVERYMHLIEPVDIVYQDIAQRNQVEIFMKNLCFLKEHGYGIIMLKARSIDAILKPERIYKYELEKLKAANLKILDTIDLKPYEKDHLAIVTSR